MAAGELKLTIQFGSKTIRTEKIEVASSITVEELKRKLTPITRLPVHQQGLSVDRTGPDGSPAPLRLNSLKRTLGEAGVKTGETVIVKNLGPQIGYSTVFYVEYAGPIAIMALYALRPSVLYGSGASDRQWNPVALYAMALWIAHFVKRELETMFVHKFSRPTMPMFNLVKNSLYYWGFALAVGYPLCHPSYTAPKNDTQVLLGASLMIVSEIVNFLVHIQLSSMRPASGSDKRDVPGGPLFALVSCPNYTAEILSWVGFSIMTQIGLAYAFTIVGFLQMAQWALDKHRGYKKSDPNYAKLGRTAIVPFLL